MEKHIVATCFDCRSITVRENLQHFYCSFADLFLLSLPNHFMKRWAVDGNFIFGEWLIGSCQHILIQEYVRLLNSWCEWNKYSRKDHLDISFGI